MYNVFLSTTTSDEVSIAKEYSLVATVNHSGTWNAGKGSDDLSYNASQLSYFWLCPATSICSELSVG